MVRQPKKPETQHKAEEADNDELSIDNQESGVAEITQESKLGKTTLRLGGVNARMIVLAIAFVMIAFTMAICLGLVVTALVKAKDAGFFGCLTTFSALLLAQIAAWLLPRSW